MENNSENFDFDQNVMVTNSFLGSQKGYGDLAITPYPTVPQNNESRNAFFMCNSLKYPGTRARSGGLDITPFHQSRNEPFIKGSHGILTGYEDLATAHANIQQDNVRVIDTPISNATFNGITTTFSSGGPNSAPFMPDTLAVRDMINHIGSSNDNFNNHENIAKTSRNNSRSANKVNGSRSGGKRMKRIRFKFVMWTDEEKKLMDQELPKCMFFPIKEIFKKIAALLPKKSIRDVIMRVQWLIKNKKLDDIWDWVEPSPIRDLSDFSFYMPDNPNDPDLLAIRNRFHPRAIKRNRI